MDAGSYLYGLRWRIEEVFRVLKSDGLDIEESQLQAAGRLLNLAALGLVPPGPARWLAALVAFAGLFTAMTRHCTPYVLMGYGTK